MRRAPNKAQLPMKDAQGICIMQQLMKKNCLGGIFSTSVVFTFLHSTICSSEAGHPAQILSLCYFLFWAHYPAGMQTGMNRLVKNRKQPTSTQLLGCSLKAFFVQKFVGGHFLCGNHHTAHMLQHQNTRAHTHTHNLCKCIEWFYYKLTK